MPEQLPADLTGIMRFPRGARGVAVPRLLEYDQDAQPTDEIGGIIVIDQVEFKPYRRGDQIIMAGYHAASDQWFIADE